jgi:hypothetical protein
MTARRFAAMQKPDLTIYTEDEIVTLQMFDGAFSIHLRMTRAEAYELGVNLALASTVAAEQKEAA